jgi:hypothetical protein
VDREYNTYGAKRLYNVYMPKTDLYRYYVTMGYLPFMEVSIRLAGNYRFRLKDFSIQWPPDRGASVRIRLLKEKKYTPALVAGAHDFLSAFEDDKAIWFNALYLVGTKNIMPFHDVPVEFGISLGYGTDRMEAKHHEFVGLFGGASVQYRNFATVMFEYDTEKVNGGVKFVFFRHLRLILALLNMNSFSSGVSYAFLL